jgi:hypothetical protein
VIQTAGGAESRIKMVEALRRQAVSCSRPL